MSNKIIVRKSPRYPFAELVFKNKSYLAVIGREGAVTANNKKEGDWKTPIGTFDILGVYHRPDRVERPKTELPVYEIKENSVWVDEVESELYNQPTTIDNIDASTSHEKLYREDHLYDVFLDLSYNRKPATPGKGGAIFMHIARDEQNPGNTSTAGCIALSKENLLEIISGIEKDTLVQISP